ncbi:MAG: lysophospholipid acyltransferase family protein [Candidatus Eisenbacteria bacterium]|nr:lysophospholipid acyltransferase family protein [Candidatus Eisenbacteria bacterium]
MSAPLRPWWMPLAVAAGGTALWLLARTWRIERVGMAERDRRLAAGERCLYAFWHARLLPLIFTHRRRGIAVLVSQSRDGELTAGIIARFGFVSARGSSTRGGDEGLRDMLRWARRGRLLAVTPDGPRGPRERLKPGLVVIASRTGLPIIPVATSGHPCWTLRSWDGFRVPRPFAKVVVAYGEPVQVPGVLDESGVEAWRLAAERAIRDLTAAVARRSGEAAP